MIYGVLEQRYLDERPDPLRRSLLRRMTVRIYRRM